MATSFGYDVFLSYRHQEPDRGVVLDLVRRLEQDGYRVALDEHDFATEIGPALSRLRAALEARRP